ncbi:MAG: hypothetical protein AAFQ58_11060 [Pseudomonadota bacterium]
MEFFSRLAIGIGILVFVGALLLGRDGSFGNMTVVIAVAAIALATTIGMAGFYGLIFAQLGRAGVDSAEYAQQSLQVAREQLEISRQALAQARNPSQGYATTQPSHEEDAGSSGTGDATLPSYRNNADAPQASHDVSASSKSGTAVPKTEAAMIENSPDVPLPDLSDEIHYENGRYYAAGKRFWSRKEAEDFLRKTQKSPATA